MLDRINANYYEMERRQHLEAQNSVERCTLPGMELLDTIESGRVVVVQLSCKGKL